MSEEWKFYLLLAVLGTSVMLFVRMARSLRGRMFGMAPAGLKAKMEKGEDLLLLDVRTPEEFAFNHVPGSVNVPLPELADRLVAIKDHLSEHAETSVVVICETGQRAFKAVPQLQKKGLRHGWVLLGGVNAWRAAGYPLTTSFEG